MTIPDPDLDELQPCLEDLKSYLETSYKCVPGSCYLSDFKLDVISCLMGHNESLELRHNKTIKLIYNELRRSQTFAVTPIYFSLSAKLVSLVNGVLLIASVLSEDEAVCKSSTHMTVVETEGYLSNMVADETGCGAPQAPWRIKAKPGLYIIYTNYISK